MKGVDKELLNDRDYYDYIKFLNCEAYSFYRGRFIFTSSDYGNSFKANMLGRMMDFENVIRGTFQTGLDLEGINITLFKKMFPNLSNNIFPLNNSDDVANLGIILEAIRNINAHSIASFISMDVLRLDYSSLRGQKVFDENIHLLTEENYLTVAGLVFIISNLLREESIKNMTTIDYRLGIITCGRAQLDEGTLFVSEISKVNLELKIREDNKKDVLCSVLGDFCEKVSTDNGAIDLLVGNYDNPIIHVNAYIDDKEIKIYKNSQTSIFFEHDYFLKIRDKDHFVELANQFPPFVFVDLLYKLSIDTFDEDAYKKITGPQWGRYSKLMYSKFYIDKNIDILLASASKADTRIVSNVCKSVLPNIFIRLEKLITKYYEIHLSSNHYSTIKYLLAKIDVPKETVNRIVAIRNCSSHGRIINDYYYCNDEPVHYSLETIVNAFHDLIGFFKNSNAHVYECFTNDVIKFFVGSIIAIKTKLYKQESRKALIGYPNNDNMNALEVKSNFYNNSIYDVEIFKSLFEITQKNPIFIKTKIEEFKFDLVFDNSKKDLALLEDFTNKNNCAVNKDWCVGPVRYIEIVKKK